MYIHISQSNLKLKSHLTQVALSDCSKRIMYLLLCASIAAETNHERVQQQH